MGAVPPPPGITPNFTNPDYISGGIVPISAVFLTLSTVFLLIRIYTKLRIIKVFGAEDYTIIAAWVFCAVSTAISLVQQNNGNGIHIWDIPSEKFSIYMKWASASVVIYVPATALAKIAILIFYLRINPDRRFRIAVFAVLFITIGYMIAICLALIFECHPIAKSWNPVLPGHCLRIPDLYLTNGILNVVTDFMVLLVPIPMLVALQVSTRQKFIIGGVFATGSLTCILSAVRIGFVAQLLHTLDTSRDVVVPTSLSAAETNLSVICGCIMVLRPFLRKHLPFILSSDSGRVKQPSPHFVYYEEPFGGPNTPIQYRAKVSTGIINNNSGGGTGWEEKTRNNSDTTDATAVEDVELGASRDWPLKSGLMPKSERNGKIIDVINRLLLRRTSVMEGLSSELAERSGPVPPKCS